MIEANAAALSTLAAYAVATIYEAAGKCGDLAPAIRPITAHTRMAGPAWTVRIFPGEALAVLRAIAAAPAGSVLVIEAGDTERGTVWGGTSHLAAAHRRLAGVVTDGAVRDVEGMIATPLPVFARAVSVRGTLKSHPGWQQIPVAVGGVVVHPGDLVFGDIDGVVVVPAPRASAVAAAVVVQSAREQEIDRRVRAGESILSVLGLQ